MSFGAAFLARPEVPFADLPDLGGSSWGDQRVDLRCAGLDFAFEGLSAPQAAAFRRHLGPFVTKADPASPTVARTRVWRVPPEVFLHPDPRGWELWMDFDYQPRRVRAASLRLALELRWNEAGSGVDGADGIDGIDGGDGIDGVEGRVWTSVEEGPELLGVLENHLRVLVAYRLLAAGGLLLHSSGVVDGAGPESRACLFLGPSGAGKTTVARLSRTEGLAVLSDDMNAVVAGTEGGAPAGVYRVPFAGDPGLSAALGEATPLPLAALLRLRQAEAPAIRRLSPSRALAHLATCAPFVNRDPFRQDMLLENLEALLGSTPAAELEFPRSGGFWPLLRHELLETE